MQIIKCNYKHVKKSLINYHSSNMMKTWIKAFWVICASFLHAEEKNDAQTVLEKLTVKCFNPNPNVINNEAHTFIVHAQTKVWGHSGVNRVSGGIE